MNTPALAFRNPEKLARGWEIQHAERERFIRFFGGDFIVLPGDLASARLRDYDDFSFQEAIASLPARRRKKIKRPVMDADTDDEFADSETVAIIYDDVEGINFYLDFGVVEAAFADPALLSKREYRQKVLDYLRDDSVSPLPFRRLAERYPDGATELFRRLLRRPTFTWARDGDQLMRERKASFFERPALPSAAVIGGRLAPYVSP